MAGKWTEGFETHTATAQLSRKYATATGAYSTQAGRVAGNAGAPNTSSLVTPSLGLQNTWVLGFGINITGHSTLINSGNSGLYLEKGSAEQLHLEFDTQAAPLTFKVQLVRGLGGSAVTVAETTYDFAIGAWHYFELKVTARTGTNGVYELRHNGVNVLSGSSVNLAASGADGVDVFASRWSQNLSTRLRLDDIYLVDDTGSSNNDFLGPGIVEGTEVTSNGATNDWINDNTAVSDVNNFDQVNDSTSAVDDSGAGGTISSDTVGDKDLFNTTDLQQVTGNIHFVQVGIQAAMSAAGSRQLKHRYRDPGTVEGDGDTFTVDSTVFDEFITIYDTNPSDSSAWDAADIDDGQFGVEVVS